MTLKIKQQYCIKFCQKLGDNQVETNRKVQQAFGNNALSPTQTKQWLKCFKYGRASIKSDHRSGRPSTSRNNEVMQGSQSSSFSGISGILNFKSAPTDIIPKMHFFFKVPTPLSTICRNLFALDI